MNVTERVARVIASDTDEPMWSAVVVARNALAVLSDPEVLAGIAGVLREHSESKDGASFLPSCRCGWVGSSRVAWVADLARHRATALADWLRGQES